MSRTSSVNRLAVIGAGAWGTVLALLLARNGHSVTLWARRSEQAREMELRHENTARLPGVLLPDDLRVTADLSACTDGASAAFIAVPSSGLEQVAERLPPLPTLVSCSKGFGGPGLTRLSQVLKRTQPQAEIGVLTGPNLASEIAAGLPAATVAAANDQGLASSVQQWLQSSTLRVYTSPDPIGAEVGGAMKNVIALAAGMSDGLQLGDNAKATIVTRGLVEIVRLGALLGAKRETLYGLAGLGDMVATCANRGSRNHLAGERIANGSSVEELRSSGLTAEGIPAVRAVHEFAAEKGISLPIAAEVYRVAFEGKDPKRAIDDLMTRVSGPEW